MQDPEERTKYLEQTRIVVTDETPLIERLQPALTGKNPRQRLSLYVVLMLLALAMTTLLIGANWGLSIDVQQPLIVHILLFLGALVSAIIATIAAVIFLKTLDNLLRSLDSKKDSQQAGRIAHQKAAQTSQANKPRSHRREASHSESRA